MRISPSVKTVVGSMCFALGTVWAAAGVMHMLLGTAVTLPLLPPIDLLRVRESTAFATAMAYYVAGALFGRSASRAVHEIETEHRASDLGGVEAAEMLSQNGPVAV